MGFFGKLFEKKVCDLCGGEIGLLGNRKLEDGNCCKECAKKLSPFFSERRSSTVEEIRAQLEYREANRAEVAAFHTTRTLGRYTKVLLDEDAGKFMVTAAQDLEEANPDVLQFSQVTGCDIDIDEDRDEVEREVRDSNGSVRHESYSPRRYEFSYDFHVVIHVNHPYFDEIRVEIGNSIPVDGGRGGFRIEGSTVPPTLQQRRDNPEYAECEAMCNEIREALTQARNQAREDIQEAAAPKAAVTCPWCGATTTPNASGCCEYCGGSLIG